MAHLTLIKSPEGLTPNPVPGSVFRLTAERTLIGRDPDAAKDGSELILLPHHAVSRKHAEIVRSGDGFLIRGLGARSGPFVNSMERRADNTTPLADGDRIKICDFLFVFHAGTPDAGAPANPTRPDITPPAS